MVVVWVMVTVLYWWLHGELHVKAFGAHVMLVLLLLLLLLLFKVPNGGKNEPPDP